MDLLISSEELVVIVTTESSHLNAENLAKGILKRKLAACVTLREVESHFWWDGNLESKPEFELLIKSRKENLNQLLETLNDLHSYQTPELIFGLVSSNEAYFKWVQEVTSICDETNKLNS